MNAISVHLEINVEYLKKLLYIDTVFAEGRSENKSDPPP